MKKQMPQYVQEILNKLKPCGPIAARAMFGGYGIYYGDTMVAALVQEQLYFRVDDITVGDYDAYNAKPFMYAGTGKLVILPYRLVPDEIMNNESLLACWLENAYQAACRAKIKKSKKKKKN